MKKKGDLLHNGSLLMRDFFFEREGLFEELDIGHKIFS
jgi:hypothetical protein